MDTEILNLVWSFRYQQDGQFKKAIPLFLMKITILQK